MSPLLKQAFVLAIATTALAVPSNQHRQHKHLHRKDVPGKYGYNPSTSTCIETASAAAGYPVASVSTKPHFTYSPVTSSTAVVAPVSESAQGTTPTSPAAASESAQGTAPASPAAASESFQSYAPVSPAAASESSNVASPVTNSNGAGSAPAPVAASSCPAVPDVTITTTTKVYVTVTETASAESQPASESSSNVAPSPVGPATTSSSTPQPPTPSAYSSSSSSAEAAPVNTSAAPPAYSVTTSSPSSPEAASTTSVSVASYQQSSSAVASATQAQPSSYSGAPSSSGKRGLAYNDASLLSCFSGNKEINWAYNWKATPDNIPEGLSYIPTLWGQSPDFTSTWNENAQSAISSGSKYLFSFNEPDNAGQSAMSPEVAAQAYKQWMQPFAGKDVKLVAPSVTNGGAPMGLTWLSNFLNACDGCQIDALNLHWYSPIDATENFKDHISNGTQMAGGKPVFISEFAPTDGSDADISTFLQDVMPWMDSQPSVLGYAFFMASDGKLITGTEPSTYGKVYAEYTSSS